MTYSQILKAAQSRLEAAGVSEYESDAWILFSETFEISRSSYFFKKDEEMPDDKLDLFFERLMRRENTEPVQYILGKQNFFGLDFLVTPDVLIPRLDTEVLVESILNEGVANKKVLDLCTGSGCIGITICHEGKPSEVIATDISQDALAVAKKNNEIIGTNVSFYQGDLFGAVDDLDVKFDVIVSNPPYIAQSEIKDISPEVLEHEPHLALFAEDDGLYFYKKILERADEFLAQDGKIWFEIGYLQGERVCELAHANGFSDAIVLKDLAGLDRVVRIRR